MCFINLMYMVMGYSSVGRVFSHHYMTLSTIPRTTWTKCTSTYSHTVHIVNSTSTGKVEETGSEIQGHPLLWDKGIKTLIG